MARVTTNCTSHQHRRPLRESGHEQKTLREEIRDNLLAALREGRDPWPGLHGFDTTVIPQLERALLAGHDVVCSASAARARPGCCARWSACSTSGRR